jgi:hypothetical protein
MAGYAALPQYNPGGAVNFDPLNQGIDSVGNALARRRIEDNNRNTNALMAKRDYAGAQASTSDPALALQIGQAQRADQSASLDNESKLAHLYGGVGQMILNEKDDAKANAMWGHVVASHPEFVTNLQKYGIDPNNHRAGAQFITAQAAGYKDPGEQALNKATIAEKYAHARSLENDAFAVNTVTGQTYSKKTGLPVAGTGVGTDTYQTIADKEFAKKSPEYVQKTAGEYQDASDSLQSIQDLKALAPYASTGFAGDSLLTLKKAASRIGIKDDGIAPAELFRSLQQNFVLTAAQKLKPLSNSDVAFVEKGVATLNTDPSSLPILLDGFEAIAKRTALAKQYQLEYLKQGRQPDYVRIEQEVSRQIPSPIAQRYGGAQPQPQVSPQQAQGQPQTQPTGPRAGDKAYNPQTKHFLVFDGQNWVDGGT